MRTFIYKMLFVLLIPVVGFGQTVNEGVISVLPNTEISTIDAFFNEKEGFVNNDGSIYFYSHFTNNGLYSFSEKQKSSYAVFQSDKDSPNLQKISGSSPSEFYDVLFQNSLESNAFQLNNDMSISGTANFLEGIVKIDSLEGAMVFQQGSKSINASDKSYVDGEVEKVGNESFDYPIGNAGMYRYAKITAPKSSKDVFFGKYYFKNSNSKQAHTSRAGVIEKIDNQEYWTIEQGAGTKSDIILTLSWDPRTTPSDLLEKAEKELRIVRWDSTQKLWVNEGGIVDMESKTISTPTTVGGYGIFTLGTVKEELLLEGDVVIYNGVTPNGDGQNDHFIIENIERFPNNKVEIFNRWGSKVYSTTAYNNLDNNFSGYSEGRITVKKGEQLPTGTYYYIVEYEYSDAKGSRMIKKSGYLHLETE